MPVAGVFITHLYGVATLNFISTKVLGIDIFIFVADYITFSLYIIDIYDIEYITIAIGYRLVAIVFYASFLRG